MLTSDFNFKISLPGNDVNNSSPSQLVVDDRYPTWKCDLRSNPKHFGTINFNIASLAPFPSSTIIYQIPHGYPYIPSFLTIWNYPAGTDPAFQSINSTFGIGDIPNIRGNGIGVTMQTDQQFFTITATNFGNSAVANVAGTIRFYIFANDFISTPISL